MKRVIQQRNTSPVLSSLTGSFLKQKLASFKELDNLNMIAYICDIDLIVKIKNGKFHAKFKKRTIFITIYMENRTL